MKLRSKDMGNDYALIRSNGSSQIDFVQTDKEGLKYIDDFNISVNDWHTSDHRPVSLEIALKQIEDIYSIYTRAIDFNQSEYNITPV